MYRRSFIKKSTIASTLCFAPSFLNSCSDIFEEKRIGDKRLVIIQLSGGNDGLNTVVPYTNDIYYRERKSIALKKDKILKIDNNLGLHKSLYFTKNLYDQGNLSILNNVGYPNINRSHFRSTDIWQSASNSDEYLQTGWIGRYIENNCNYPYNAIQLDDYFPLIMKGRDMSGIATYDIDRLYNESQDPFFKQLIQTSNSNHKNEHNLGYLNKTLTEVQSSTKYLFDTSKTYKSKQSYKNTFFSKHLKSIAELINSRSNTGVYYTSLDGFDTHSNQLNTHESLLKVFDEGIECFVKDLKQHNTFKDTIILIYSEFGRRVKQNGSDGTDHGAANNVFIIGNNLRTKGIYNPHSSLLDLDYNGDIKFEIDFRRIYATILEKWLNVDSKKILGREFETLNFL